MTIATKLKPVPTLESMTLAWIMAKQHEDAARAERLAIEQQIVAALPGAHPEAIRLQVVGGYRVAVKYAVTRRVDSERLQAMWGELPPQAHGAFRWKAEVALPKLRALQELLPDVYAQLVPAIEAKPAKPSVTIELAKEAA